jgi:serine/threonine protein kinase
MVWWIYVLFFLAFTRQVSSLTKNAQKSPPSQSPNRSPLLNRKLAPGDSFWTSIGVLQVMKALGQGSFGAVFQAKWVAANQLVALKIELPQAVSKCVVGNAPKGYLTIEHEWRMMSAMNGTEGFPEVYTHNFKGKYKYYVMQLLGKSLSAVRKSYPSRKIDTRSLISYGRQMLRRIEALHKRDALMYDIHLGNFLVKGDRVYVIDLGMAIPFRYMDGQHVHYSDSPISNDCKNAYYSTKHDVSGLQVSRRDDLERLLYVLVDLNTNNLPWSGLKEWDDIQRKKLNSTSADICTGSASWLKPAFDYVFSIPFTEEPNYNLLHLILDERSKHMR